MLDSQKPISGATTLTMVRATVACHLFFFLMNIAPSALAQSPGGGGAPMPTPAAGGGTISIESQMIAYEAVDELARAIANPFSHHCVDRKLEELKKTDNGRKIPKAEMEARMGKAQIDCKIADVTLLGSPSNLAAIAAFRTYETLATQLQQRYEDEANLSGEDRKADRSALSAGGVADVASTANSIASTINTLKTQSTQTGSSFAPVEQVLYSDLERSYDSAGSTLIVMPYPANYINGANRASQDFSRVDSARRKAISHLKKSPTDDPTQGPLKDLESAWLGFQGVLSGTSGPTVLQGAALIEMVGPNLYDVLTVQTAAAGGNERGNVYFLLNVFYPAPHHLYDGGAVVAYTVRSSNGEYKDGGTLRMMYGLTKWNPPSLHKKDKGFTNINDWDARKENGGHRHWWRY